MVVWLSSCIFAYVHVSMLVIDMESCVFK
jgi:hypothetical protein